LNHVPKEDWPDNVPLLYYVYHIMVGLGTFFIAISVIAAFLLWRKQLYTARWMLWILLLAVPFPYIANTAGWMTAEFGRQPWLVYGLLRTVDGYSNLVSPGNGWFTFLGFLGMYAILSMLFFFLVLREIDRGPEATDDKVRGLPRAPAIEHGLEITEDYLDRLPVGPAKVR
jgi:cytochrome d ubiquinol oxidase subunit I